MNFEKYLKYKIKYLNLLNGGKGPFKFLVLGGGNPDLYNELFYEVGNHPTSDFGSGQDWNISNFWKLLIIELETKKLKFDAIIIDTGSFSWFHNITNIINDLLELFKIALDKNGILLITAYYPYDIQYKYDSKIRTSCIYYLNNKLLKDDNFKPVYDLRFNNLHNTPYIYRIYQKIHDELTISKEKLYPIDYNFNYAIKNVNGYIDFCIEQVEEKNQIEFLINRFTKQQTSNNKCGISNKINKLNKSNSAYAVCCNYGRKDEKEFINNPRILVCLLNILPDKPEYKIKLKDLENLKKLNDILVRLDLNEYYPELIKLNLNINNINFSEVTFRNENLLLVKYDQYNDLTEYNSNI